jgi:hypothetical protein
MKNLKIGVSILVLIVGFTSCDKNEGSARLRVLLHDKPLEADSLIVDVTGVSLHHEDEGWINLNAQTGLYDLLQLQNGVDTLLVPVQEIPEGHVTQIRLLLGTNNYLVQDDVIYPLSISSQDETGLKVNLHEDFVDGDDLSLYLDFDAEASIIQTGDSTYKLKPVVSAHLE